MLDMNDAADQMRFGSVIPDGTFVKLQLNIKAGGADLPKMEQADKGLFSASTSSDAIGLSVELTVLEPSEHMHRKIFEWWTVAGGALDEKGQSKAWGITKSRLRALLESATGTDPKDTSPAANANRMIPNFRALDNAPFYAKLTIEEGNDKPSGGKYPDKNKIDYIVTPADAEYAVMKSGTAWPALKPRNSPGGGGSAKATAPSVSAPAWQRPETKAAPTQPGPNPAPAANAGVPAGAPATGPAWLRQ